MIKLTIYRIGETIETNIEGFGTIVSNKIHVYGRIDPETGLREDIRYRPYYRRYIDGVLNVFAEEEVDELDSDITIA